MKKLICTLFIIGFTLTMTACGNEPQSVTPSTEPATEVLQNNEQPNLEELGEIIVAAGTFWEDWWSMNGRFALENIDFDEQIGDVMSRLLPESGFNNLDDVRQYLLKYYTESWVDQKMASETFVFAEYFDILYVHAIRAGFVRPNWETAEHLLIEQDGNRVTVKTTVLVGGWHRYPYEDPLEHAYESTYHFTFTGGRIEHVDREMIFYTPIYEVD